MDILMMSVPGAGVTPASVSLGSPGIKGHSRDFQNRRSFNEKERGRSEAKT
jgi:hypothetical protein